jgi:riboflavin synthase
MFTGIIQEIGKVKAANRQGGNLRLEIEAPELTPRIKLGDSVSINGACQTVVSLDHSTFAVDAISETLSRTNLGGLRVGSQVNLELPLGLGDLLHGHLVQGHVDCVGRIAEIRPISGSTIYAISYPHEYAGLLIEKGSIAVDGVSLTITDISDSTFQIALIPHTIEKTVFRYRNTGETVNLEFDMVAKHIQRMTTPNRGNITPEFLKENGF